MPSYAGLADVACGGYRAAQAPLSLSSFTTPGCASLHARHEGTEDTRMITGTVKFLFIAPENGESDAHVQVSAVERAGVRTLDKDQWVTYGLETDRRGKASAVNLQPA